MVATAAVIAGFGGAVLVYGPLGTGYRQTSASGAPLPPTGVTIGLTPGNGVSPAVYNATCAVFACNAEELFTSDMFLTNASPNNPSWNWSQGGPCNNSGILNSTGGYEGYDFANASVAVTTGNVTLVCLDSVGSGNALNNTGNVSATWYYNTTGVPLVNNTYNSTTWMSEGGYYSSATQNISDCNYFTAGNQSWNATHTYNATIPLVPCQGYYQLNANTTYIPSFAGVNTTKDQPWVENQSGYLAADVDYEVPIIFLNTSQNGTYEIDVAIGGVTPVGQTFFFNNTVGGTSFAGEVLFVFDMTAGWLYDTTHAYDGNATPSNITEVYGGIGVVSAIITQCSSDNVCPNASSAMVASDANGA